LRPPPKGFDVQIFFHKQRVRAMPLERRVLIHRLRMRGDTLEAIAKRCGITVNDVVDERARSAASLNPGAGDSRRSPADAGASDDRGAALTPAAAAPTGSRTP